MVKQYCKKEVYQLGVTWVIKLAIGRIEDGCWSFFEWHSFDWSFNDRCIISLHCWVIQPQKDAKRLRTVVLGHVSPTSLVGMEIRKSAKQVDR